MKNKYVLFLLLMAVVFWSEALAVQVNYTVTDLYQTPDNTSPPGPVGFFYSLAGIDNTGNLALNIMGGKREGQVVFNGSVDSTNVDIRSFRSTGKGFGARIFADGYAIYENGWSQLTLNGWNNGFLDRDSSGNFLLGSGIILDIRNNSYREFSQDVLYKFDAKKMSDNFIAIGSLTDRMKGKMFHASFWRDGEFIVMDESADSRVLAINDAGTFAVGQHGTNEGFVYDINTQSLRLFPQPVTYVNNNGIALMGQTLVYPDGSIVPITLNTSDQEIYANMKIGFINDNNQIGGLVEKNDEWHILRLEPIPEPETYALIGGIVSFVIIFGFRHRKRRN